MHGATIKISCVLYYEGRWLDIKLMEKKINTVDSVVVLQAHVLLWAIFHRKYIQISPYKTINSDKEWI
jgi:hypothetical protein